MTIEIKNLSKQYNSISAVKNINFNINKGSIVGLLGPNGCGKTTTIGMMLGLIKPTVGEVFINNQNIENENSRTKILRPGSITPEKISKILKKKIEINKKVKKIKSPGQLKSHYSPGIPVVIGMNARKK